MSLPANQTSTQVPPSTRKIGARASEQPIRAAGSRPTQPRSGAGHRRGIKDSSARGKGARLTTQSERSGRVTHQRPERPAAPKNRQPVRATSQPAREGGVIVATNPADAATFVEAKCFWLPARPTSVRATSQPARERGGQFTARSERNGPSIHPRPARNPTHDWPPVRTTSQVVQATVDADFDHLEAGRGEQDRNDNEESNFDQHNNSGSNFQSDKEEILLQNGGCCSICTFILLAVVIAIFTTSCEWCDYFGLHFIGVFLLICAVIMSFYIFVSGFDAFDKCAMIVAASLAISCLASMISYICLLTSVWTTWMQILFFVFTSSAMVLSLVLAYPLFCRRV